MIVLSQEKFPKRLVVEMTTHCNLSCIMCPRQYVEVVNGYISSELWKKVIDEVSEKSPETIIIPFWRGEPLLHPDFSKLIKYVLDKSLRVHISTNGHFVDGKYVSLLAQCEFVSFSIHTDIGFANAKKFNSFCRKKRTTVQASFVRGVGETDNICNVLIASSNLGGFDSIRIYEKHTINGVFGKLKKEVNSTRYFCPKLNDTLVVAYDGFVSRCNHIWVTDKLLNVDIMDVEEVWNSIYLRKIRENYPDKKCVSCDQWIGHTCGEVYTISKNNIEHKVFD